MTHLDSDNHQTEPVQEVPQVQASFKRKGPAHGWMAWTAFMLTIAAWVMLHFNGTVCFWLAVCGLVTSMVALRQRNRACHNLALVALVASAVLLLVLAIVYIALHYLLG